MILATMAECADVGGIALLLVGTAFIRNLTIDARLHHGLREADSASYLWWALAPECTGTVAGRFDMKDSRTQLAILHALSALADRPAALPPLWLHGRGILCHVPLGIPGLLELNPQGAQSHGLDLLVSRDSTQGLPGNP